MKPTLSLLRLRRLALYLAGLFVLFVLAGYFIVPPVAKSLIVKQATKAKEEFNQTGVDVGNMFNENP